MGGGLVGAVRCLAFLLLISIRSRNTVALQDFSSTDGYSSEQVEITQDINIDAVTERHIVIENTTLNGFLEILNKTSPDPNFIESSFLEENRKRSSVQKDLLHSSQNIQANVSTQTSNILYGLRNSSHDLDVDIPESRSGYPDAISDDFKAGYSSPPIQDKIQNESNLLAEAEALAQILNETPHYNSAYSTLQGHVNALEQILSESNVSSSPLYSQENFTPFILDREKYPHNGGSGPIRTDKYNSLQGSVYSSLQGKVYKPVQSLKEIGFVYNAPQVRPELYLRPIADSNNNVMYSPQNPAIDQSVVGDGPSNDHTLLASQINSVSQGLKDSVITPAQTTGGEYYSENIPTYDSHQLEALAKIHSARKNTYNQEHSPLVGEALPFVISESHPRQDSLKYILPKNEVAAIIQAIKGVRSPNTQDGTSKASDLSLTQNLLYNSELSSPQFNAETITQDLPYSTVYSFAEPQTQSVHKGSQPYYTNVIHQSDLILLNNIPGAENLIKCTREGQFHSLFTPSQQCLVCACVENTGHLYPICASCSDCPVRTEPTLRDKYPTSPCDPLPVGVTFEHPLNPCHICMCYVIGNNNTQISCQKDPQCVKPAESPLNLIPHSSLPIKTPLCEKFPEDVEFPHPTESCQRCICYKQKSSFTTIQDQLQMQCVPVPDCDLTSPEFEPTHITSAPIPTIPTVSFTTPVTVPLVPADQYSIVPSIAPSHFVPNFTPITPDLIQPPDQNPTASVQPTGTTPFLIHTPLHKPFFELDGLLSPTSQTGPYVPNPTTFEPDQSNQFKSIPPFGVIIPEILATSTVSTPTDVLLAPDSGTHPPSLFPNRPASPFILEPVAVPAGIVPYTRSPAPLTTTTSTSTSVTPLPWPPISTDGSSEPYRGPLLGPPPHESCQPYPSEAEFQHPWDECKLCRCSEYHSRGHVSIEVNCYSKQSCSKPEHPEHFHVLDKMCALKTFGAEFVDPTDECRACACRLFGHFVVPVCRRVAGDSDCPDRPASVTTIIYIEPRCQQQEPNQQFSVGCRVCTCHSVYNYVIATCSSLPDCDESLSYISNARILTAPYEHDQGSVSQINHEVRPILSSDDIRAIAEYLSLHKLKGYLTPPDLSSAGQTKILGATQNIRYPYQTAQGYSLYNLNQNVKQSTGNQMQSHSFPSNTREQTVMTQASPVVSTSTFPARYASTAGAYTNSFNIKSPTINPNTYLGKQAVSTISPEFGYLPYSYAKRPSLTKLHKTAYEEEEDNTSRGSSPKLASADENSYPYSGESASTAAETRTAQYSTSGDTTDLRAVPWTNSDTPTRNYWDLTTLASTQRNPSTQALAQQLTEAGGTISGRGRCQFVGDLYYQHCQACYCFAGIADLFSVCMGTPCNN